VDLWPPFPPPSIPAALRDVNSRKPAFRARAAASLGDLTGHEEVREQAIVSLRKLLSDRSPDVRGTAALSLGRLGAVEAMDDVIRLAEESDELAAQDAIAALGYLQDGRASACIRKALRHADADVRFQAVIAIVMVDPAEAGECLDAALQDPDQEVRACAVSALGDLGDPQSTSRLRPLLEDRDASVRFEAAITLVRLGNADGAPVLVDALSDRAMAPDASLYLGKLRHRGALDRLKGVYKRFFFPAAARIHAAAAAASMGDSEAASFLEDRMLRKGLDGHLARSATGTLGIEALLDPLADALCSSDSEVAESAAAALLEMDTPGARDRIRSRLGGIRETSLREEMEEALAEAAGCP